MGSLLTLGWWVLACAGGCALLLAFRVTLRLEEHLLAGLVIGVVGGTMVGMLAAFWKLDVATAELSIALFALLALLLAAPRISSQVALMLSEARARRKALLPFLAVTGAAGLGFSILFAHTLFVARGGIYAGFSPVWSDWSLHATTANSFVLSANFPPGNPVHSGTTLAYPFVADFQAAIQLVFGVPLAQALWVPCAVLMTALTGLVLSLTHRLCNSYWAGAIACAVIFLGGSLGFLPFLEHACRIGAGKSCQAVPASWPGDVASTLRGLFPALSHQTVAYDGLGVASGATVIPDQQWYTPLLAWWLPQRDYVYGYPVAVLCLLLVVVYRRATEQVWGPYVLAGLLAATLVMVQIHLYMCLALLAVCMALTSRRKEWWGCILAAVLAPVPRFLLLAKIPHGNAATASVFPTIQPGWMASADVPHPPQPLSFSAPHLLFGLVAFLGDLLNPVWWEFWIMNLGPLVPVMFLAGIVFLLLWLANGLRESEADLWWVCIPFLSIFLFASVVVVGAWNWDNTKLFGFFVLGAGIVLGAAVTSQELRLWVRLLAGLAVLVSVATGLVVMARSLPWTPPQDAEGPYLWQSAGAIRMAQQVERVVPQNAIIATSAQVNDPVSVLTGRTAFMGYPGWLWSYGELTVSRQVSEAAIQQGCYDTPPASCRVGAIVQRYHISYVEIPVTAPSYHWWMQHYGTVASDKSYALFSLALPLTPTPGLG